MDLANNDSLKFGAEPQVSNESISCSVGHDPYMRAVKLPRCANQDCPDPVHPLAKNPETATPDICPGCGGPASEPEVVAMLGEMPS